MNAPSKANAQLQRTGINTPRISSLFSFKQKQKTKMKYELIIAALFGAIATVNAQTGGRGRSTQCHEPGLTKFV